MLNVSGLITQRREECKDVKHFFFASLPTLRLCVFKTQLFHLTLLATVLLVPVGTRGQEVLTKKPDETIENFGKRIIPPKTELAHKVLTGAFGPSPDNILLLFRGEYDINSNYTGWVLVPKDNSAGAYRKLLLPPMTEIPGHFEISVSSVLFANADKDKESELIVLYEYYRNGSGEKPGNAAYVYDWNGNEFVVLDDTSTKLVGLKTAAAVRRKLKALGY
jgi:hypothetical protein